MSGSTSLLVVTGAPGSGKTTVAELLASMDHEFTVFDIDWLIDPASDLAGQRIEDSPGVWRAYSALWFEVLHASIKNSQTPLFFCPNSAEDFQRYGVPHWCSTIHWALLDCDESSRRTRLGDRGWSDLQLSEAIDDANALRRDGLPIFDTSQCTLREIANKILGWARQN